MEVNTADLPIRRDVTVATYADDTAILVAHQDPEIASRILQTTFWYSDMAG